MEKGERKKKMEEDGEFEVQIVNRKRNAREARIATMNRPESVKILKRTAESPCYTKGDLIPLNDMENHLRSTGFLSDDWLIHKRRAENGILYALLFFPRSITETVDEETHETHQVELISKVCNDAVESFEFKYGDCLTKDHLIGNIFTYLKSPETSTRIKLFFILYAMTLSPHLTRCLAEECTGIGLKKPQDYIRVAKVLKGFLYRVSHGVMIEETNVHSIVNDTINVAINIYLDPLAGEQSSSNFSATRTK